MQKTTDNNQNANASGAFGLLTIIYWYQTGRLDQAFNSENSFIDSLLILLSSYTEWQAWVFILIFGIILLLLMMIVVGGFAAIAAADGKVSPIEIVLGLVLLIVIMPIYVLIAQWSLVTFLL